MIFPASGPGSFPRLKFRYWNWQGEDHEYVIIPESVEVGSYDISGKHGRARPLNVVLHGAVVTKDSRDRRDRGNQRRTFIVAKMREIEILP